MRLSETKDELTQCFASVSILFNHNFFAVVDVDSSRQVVGVSEALSHHVIVGVVAVGDWVAVDSSDCCGQLPVHNV